MAKRSDIPIEERDYSHIYFVCSALLAVATFWAVIDMIWVRSPWQRTQREFNRIEKEDLQAKLNAEVEKLTNGESKDQYANLLASLQEARAGMKSPEYQQALQDSAKVALEIQQAVQQYRFAKSEADAEYYLYKEAQYHNDEPAQEKHGKNVERLTGEYTEWKSKWDAAEEKKRDVQARLAGFRQQMTDIHGQLAALTKERDELQFRIDRVDERPIKIQQVVMPEFVKSNFGNFISNVDRCHTCHVSFNRKGFEEAETPFRTHSSLDTLLRLHPVERFGCTPCHEGQGPALQNVKFAHGFAKFWLHPLLTGKYVQAGCNKCHAKELRLQYAENLNKAKRMVFDLGCYGCHEISGYETLDRIGPDLSRIAQKLEPGFVYGWLRDNREFRPHSRMPNPMYTHEEAAAATAYLFDASNKNGWSPAPMPASGNAARGEGLVETVGCKGCHVVDDSDRELRPNDLPYDMAPDLSAAAAKASSQWLFDWIKNPKRFSPTTRMPNLRLSDQEAADIVAYLETFKSQVSLPANYTAALPDLSDQNLINEGKAVLRNFGCHGCHVIPGLENEGRVSVSLNEFGAKPVEELFYGDALAKKAVEKTWEGWTTGKLKNSRLYATEAVIQRMPNYQLSEEDATSLAVLLRSWDGRVIGERYVKQWSGQDEAVHAGRLLVRKYNCTGCHLIEGEGWDIKPSLTQALGKEGIDEIAASAYAPPDLISQGQKVQGDWFFRFLKEPKTGEIRPWLRTRMPTFNFSDKEANTLVDYFKSLEGEAPGFTYLPEFELTAEQRAGALKLVSKDYFDCFSCHQQGNIKPEGPPDGWAPDLAMASQRLNPNWVAAWIRDPQALQPGTKMPSFYPDSYPPDVLDGDPDKQIVALRNYLLSLSNGKR